MQSTEQARFDPGELAVALSHYDLGVIESITDFPRGSRRSPKVGIVAERGKFLLKRRSLERLHSDRIRFAHLIQAHLARAGFPVPRLMPTRDGKQELVQIRNHVYELFEYVAGQHYERTADEAHEAGRTLARFHQCLRDFAAPPDLPVPRGDYHDTPGVRTGLCGIGSTLSSHDSFTGDDAELAGLTQTLLAAYDEAAESVARIGLPAVPEQIIHSDWHPGNILFRNREVAAVIDYDSARLSRRVIDLANGALQFSILAGGDPATWPDHVDEDRFAAFLNGYRKLIPISEKELCCIPHLMIEALIAECVAPITRTGSVGRWSGYRVLQMVGRKVGWLRENAQWLGSGNESGRAD